MVCSFGKNDERTFFTFGEFSFVHHSVHFVEKAPTINVLAKSSLMDKNISFKIFSSHD